MLTRKPALHLFPDYFITHIANMSRIKRGADFLKTLREGKEKNEASCAVTYLCTRAAGPCRSSPSRTRSRTVLCACRTCSSPSRRSSLGPLHTARSSGPGRPGRSRRWGGLRTSGETQEEDQRGAPDHSRHVGGNPSSTVSVTVKCLARCAALRTVSAAEH